MKKVFKFFVVALVVAISCTMISWKIPIPKKVPRIPRRSIPSSPRVAPVVVPRAVHNAQKNDKDDNNWIWWVLGVGGVAYVLDSIYNSKKNE